ncbi:MAG: hypothetical protein J5993_01345 [Clostridia bacterium]|nr:hypothetical protein [Clostridia bacterium]
MEIWYWYVIVAVALIICGITIFFIGNGVRYNNIKNISMGNRGIDLKIRQNRIEEIKEKESIDFKFDINKRI